MDRDHVRLSQGRCQAMSTSSKAWKVRRGFTPTRVSNRGSKRRSRSPRRAFADPGRFVMSANDVGLSNAGVVDRSTFRHPRLRVGKRQITSSD